MTARGRTVGLLGVVILAALLAGHYLKEHGAVVGPKSSGEETEGVARPAGDGEERPPLALPLESPKIIIHKSKRTLVLHSAGAPVRTYRIALGFEPTGDKGREGDGRTPEGEFYVCNRNRSSRYYLSLGLSYPNTKDAARGLKHGLITREQHDAIVRASTHGERPPWDTALGGEIFIHGNGTTRDWTWGCIALEDVDIRELFEAVPVGTPVFIHP